MATPYSTLVPGAPVKVERIAYIERMMVEDRFIRGQSVRDLAEEWGLRPQTVERDADEASRNIRRQMPDEDYRAEIIHRMDKIANAAYEERQYGTALSALRAMLEARGLLRRRDPDPVEPMTAAEIVESAFTDPELKPLIVARALKEHVQDGEFEETSGGGQPSGSHREPSGGS